SRAQPASRRATATIQVSCAGMRATTGGRLGWGAARGGAAPQEATSSSATSRMLWLEGDLSDEDLTARRVLGALEAQRLRRARRDVRDGERPGQELAGGVVERAGEDHARDPVGGVPGDRGLDAQVAGLLGAVAE